MTTLKSIDDPFGGWPMDKDASELQPLQYLSYFTSSSGGRLIALYRTVYLVKKFEGPQVELVRNELKMMLAAGECSVSPLGRIFQDGTLVGFITPYERSVVPMENYEESTQEQSEKLRSHLSDKEKLLVIDHLCGLVADLHSKGVLHGDIKPSNLLLCSDGKLRFCDFAEAMLESEARCPRGSTVPYDSPSRYNMQPPPQLSKTDDLYATGISIWEIYTGQRHFYYLDDDQEVDEDLIRAGVRPNFNLVNDERIAKLITSYLDAGEIPLPKNIFPQPWVYCIVSSLAYQDCLASSPHVYTKVVHSHQCIEQRKVTTTCKNEFKLPFVANGAERLACVHCRPIEYRGIVGQPIETSRYN